MSDSVLSGLPVLFMAGLEKGAAQLNGGLYCRIPGAEDFGRIYQADPRVLEETCAFFDDFTHDLHLERNIFELVVQDLCAVKPFCF